jgi:hypothetical protein
MDCDTGGSLNRGSDLQANSKSNGGLGIHVSRDSPAADSGSSCGSFTNRAFTRETCGVVMEAQSLYDAVVSRVGRLASFRDVKSVNEFVNVPSEKCSGSPRDAERLIVVPEKVAGDAFEPVFDVQRACVC